MEQSYLQQIYDLTSQALRHTTDLDELESQLQEHLLKARQDNLSAYEAETLNTLGIVYALQGDVRQQLKYFNLALESTKRFDNINFKVKIINNLANSYLGIWELTKALKILEKGTELITEQPTNSIGAAYIYAGIVDTYIRQGQFDLAAQHFEKAHALASGFLDQDRSRVEYFQIITLLDLYKVQLELVTGQHIQAAEHLQALSATIDGTSPGDLQKQLNIHQLYAALIIENNVAQAARIHHDLREQLDAVTALTICHFLLHNQQPAWGHRYASIALEAAKSDNNAWPTLIRLTQQIYEETLDH